MLAQYCLGMCYGLGLDIPKNDKLATYWFTKAAEQGHADSQFLLSSQYRNGRGVPKDEKQAMYWLKKSAEQGHQLANQFIYLITNGIKIPSNENS